MKKLILLLTLVFCVASAPAFAHCGMCGLDGKGSGSQEKGSSHQDYTKKKIEKMTENLGLNAIQKSQIEDIMEAKQAKKKTLNEKHKAEMKAIMDDSKTKIRAVLTEEQAAKYDAMKEEHKGSKKDGKKKSKKDSDKEMEKGS